MKQSLWKVMAILAFGTLTSSCAYQFRNTRLGAPGRYDKISVPVFANRTPETGIETYFTSSMIEEIQRAHRAQVTPVNESELVLEGQITDVKYNHIVQVQKGAAGFSLLPESTVLTKEYRIVVTTSLRVRRRSDDKILWSSSFTGERPYTAPQVLQEGVNSVNPLYNHSAHHQNIRLLSQTMMAEAYETMTEDF